MMHRWARHAIVLVVAAIFGPVAVAHASQWNERTILNFSEPVMVPGATLQPGSYVFTLSDSSSSRHTVQILEQDGTMITIAQAVPAKRPDPKGDVVLKFNPTDQGTPPALKAWFYPGSVYGHEFIYPEEQARKIAERTKTVVLSVDVPGTDLEKGTLFTYNAAGVRENWRRDAATMSEWEAWQRTRQRSGASADSSQTQGQAAAPMVQGNFEGTRVKLDDLESNTEKYIGQTISVDGEVDDVFGPRLFTIDERNWGDLDGEILVFMPSPLAAFVKEDDRVTITGTVKPFVKADVEREWGWLGLDPEIEVDFSKKPILVANRIVGGNNNVAMVISSPAAGDRPVGTTGGGATSPTSVKDLAAVAGGDDELVGRQVDLTGLKVARSAAGRGFFVQAGEQHVFVLPAKDGKRVTSGDTVSVKGVVLEMPDAMDDRLKPPANTNDEIYVYATSIGS
jgi:hypothetical protein